MVEQPNQMSRSNEEEQLPKPPKLPKKGHPDTKHGTYQQPQKQRPWQFQQETAGSIKEKNPKYKESISKFKPHSENGCIQCKGGYCTKQRIKDIALIRKGLIGNI